MLWGFFFSFLYLFFVFNDFTTVTWLLNPLPLFSFLNNAWVVLDCLHVWFDVDKNSHFCHCRLKNTNIQGLEFLGVTLL